MPDSASPTTPVDVVIRSHNDLPLVEQTLNELAKQDAKISLTAFDNASTDGTRELLEKHGAHIHHVPAGTYVPGRVLNEAMEATENEIVVFINSDCVPQSSHAVSSLVNAIENDTEIAAAFGRQVAQPDCWPLYKKDTEDTYGDGSRQKYWKHCFSMAFSAVRRSVWNDLPFRTDIQYSEDIDWTWRARQKGSKVKYAAEGVVMHSHNYSWKQFYKRQFGEGKADAQIFTWTPWEKSWWRYSVLPFGRQCLSDPRYLLKNGKILSLPSSPYFRAAQLLGRWNGFRSGLASGVTP
ncbi:MAG: glycosyltransferase [Verrucomicrobiaceae bacterium]|nr:glycosyltransferase [Verrucomicrobiaceae bacterium]